MSILSRIFLPLKDRRFIAIVLMGGLLACSLIARAQDPTQRFRSMGSGSSGKSTDSLQHRKADTITLNYRFLDSSRLEKLDSSIIYYSRKVPQPRDYVDLGNLGTAARNLVFSPNLRSGWDPGWHAYDLYTFNTAETRFYNTTKPYTELGYVLGSKNIQLIDILHTQNIQPNWNFSFEYRLISSAGSFQNQNTNHNNYRVSSWYQSKNKRYQNFFILVGNKLKASDNGGIRDFHDKDSLGYIDRSTLPVNLGNNLSVSGSSFFNPQITTGTRYTTNTYLFRQQYDLGQKDSVVTDTTVIPLFYPRLRMEHTLSYSTYHYRFFDEPSFPYTLDSSFYANQYNLKYISPQDTFFREANWKDFSNDFSLYQFPDSKNPQQFIKLGVSLQLLSGAYDTSSLAAGSLIDVYKRLNEHNEFVHGEYRNKTRNQKWDIEAFGKLYLNGLNAGDYNAYISLQRLISKKLGYLQVGFQNVNRTPSRSFDAASPFYYDSLKTGFSKENTTNIFASLDQPQYHLKLSGAYYLISNYAYLQDYYKERQQSALFNLLQIRVQKVFTLHGPWKWRTNTVFQQVAGSSPVHVPLIVSNNQIGYEGSFGYRYLNIAFGLEIRYISGYKADGYSPLTGQFYSQGDTTIRQQLPDITGYVNLRIRSFTVYVRTENLNTAQVGVGGFGFNNNNYIGPGYPTPGLLIRIGIFWGFVN
jgi:Putative porin